jgi:hypothetical protein
LLQAPQSIEIVLRNAEFAARLGELRIEGQDFFVGSAGLECGLIGLCCSETCSGASGLSADVGVIEFEQKLAFADVITFFREQTSYCR